MPRPRQGQRRLAARDLVEARRHRAGAPHIIRQDRRRRSRRVTVATAAEVGGGAQPGGYVQEVCKDDGQDPTHDGVW